MAEIILSDKEMQEILPPLPRENFSATPLQALRRKNDQVLFVIDDDPTGTQTVHDVPVLTQWSVDLIKREIENDADLIFILSNSRSMPEAVAISINREIGTNIKSACTSLGMDFLLISRSDSTLRGHYPAEVKALKESIDHPDAAELIIPAFFEGGRITVNDVHYVKEGDQWIPAAMTHFAKDKVFGYKHSNLNHWLAEKTEGAIPANQITSISLEDLRSDGKAQLRKKLTQLPPESVAIVNAASPYDLRKLAFVVSTLDRFFIYRTAASFVSSMADQSERDYLERNHFDFDEAKGGLVIVGSYVPKTTAQLSYLKANNKVISIEIDVADLLKHAALEPKQIAEKITRLINSGSTVALSTSRALIAGRSDVENLDIGKKVSNYLTDTIKHLANAPKYILTKGGITSSDVATVGLEIQRAWVMGQIIPGVPVWKAGDLSKFPHIHQIVFPGNVGNDRALSEVIHKLEAKRHQ